MNPFVAYLAAQHLQDLLAEAQAERRAKLSQASQPGVSAVRRGLGGGARRLSGLFDSAARSLDPSVEGELSAHRPATSGVGRALAS